MLPNKALMLFRFWFLFGGLGKKHKASGFFVFGKPVQTAPCYGYIAHPAFVFIYKSGV
jgi:hypothetical protein